MFQRKELEELRRRKQQLAAESDAHRSAILGNLQKLQSPGLWAGEAFGFVRRHPLGTTSLIAGAGMLAFKFIRRPRTLLNGIVRLSELVPVALSAWKMFRGKEK